MKKVQTPLGFIPKEGICGQSTDVAVRTIGQKTETIWLNEKDEHGEFIYNNTWEEAGE